jgi:hypothetical protein
MRTLVSQGLEEFQKTLRYVGVKEKPEEVFWSV